MTSLVGRAGEDCDSITYPSSSVRSARGTWPSGFWALQRTFGKTSPRWRHAVSDRQLSDTSRSLELLEIRQRGSGDRVELLHRKPSCTGVVARRDGAAR